MKETLSASLCSLARLRDYHTLYDPMCGSGTILIEGAMMAQILRPASTVILLPNGGMPCPKAHGHRSASVRATWSSGMCIFRPMALISMRMPSSLRRPTLCAQAFRQILHGNRQICEISPPKQKRARSFAILPMASECSIFSRPMNYIELWGKSLTKNADGVIILLAHLNNLNLCSAEELIKGGSYIMV